jgi:hypothetical protein
MVLLDYSQVAIGNLHQQLKYNDAQIEPNLLRHMILNSIRKANKEFGREFGQLVVCSDGHNYWRKQYFPYYKAHRKKDREDSGIDWHLVFDVLNQLREELKQNFPYKVMAVDRAEADDIIGVLAKTYHTREKILVLSGDKDFLQLQAYPNVAQFSPIRDEFLKIEDALRFLKEHIMRGDKGDGIPNFLSNDDVFVSGVRQSPVRDAKVDVWITQQPEEFCDERTLRNYRRNEKLVDLNQIPPDIQETILKSFEEPIVGTRQMIFGYLVKNRMKNLLDCIQEF